MLYKRLTRYFLATNEASIAHSKTEDAYPSLIISRAFTVAYQGNQQLPG
jgi:hypothetical protein